MKPTHHYTKMDNLEIMGTTINNLSCGKVRVEFTVDARHILLAITSLHEEEPTRKNIEARMKRELFYKGEAWYLSPLDYGEEGEHYNLREKLKEALPIGKKLFPEFFDTPNSVKFIKGLA